MRQISLLAAFVTVCALPASALAQELKGFEPRTLQGSKGLTLPYRLFKVKNPAAGTKYPVVLFLHGAGERGTDNAKQLNANAGATVWATDAHQAAHPAYVVAPQCPDAEQWVHTDWSLGSYSTTSIAISDPLTTALEIVDAIAKELPVDPARHYITGLSMGGYGTWDTIVRHPARFAAAITIAGAGDPSKANLIKDLPLWVAHGDADNVVPVKGSRDMVTALEAVGSDVKYDEYAGVDHDSWTQTYANEAVVAWLFTNQRSDVPAGGSGGGGASGSSGSGGASAGSAGLGGAGAAGTGGGVSGGSSTGGTGNVAGASSAGSSGTGVANAGSAPVANATPSDDGGCSYGARGAGSTNGGAALLLGLAALLAKRRRSRAA